MLNCQFGVLLCVRLFIRIIMYLLLYLIGFFFGYFKSCLNEKFIVTIMDFFFVVLSLLIVSGISVVYFLTGTYDSR